MRPVVRIVVLGLVVLVAAPLFAQEGRTYNVDVTIASGGKFSDCFTFHEDGSFTIFTLFDDLSWAKQNNNKKNNTFIASSRFDNADEFNLAFSGKAKAGNLKADGLNADGESFKIKGKPGECELGRLPDGPSPWLFPEVAGR